MHSSKEKPSCPTFRVVTANFWVSEILGLLRYCRYCSVAVQHNTLKWVSSFEYGTYHIGEQQRFRRASASVQYRQSLCCSHMQYLELDEASDIEPEIWLHWIATVMILSFRTEMPWQTVQTQIRLLLRVYTVCHSVCIVWTHYSMVEPQSSNFGVIATIFLGVQIFRKFTV